jgi:pimeloyl-ACP methyl ester carboxylesterase
MRSSDAEALRQALGFDKWAVLGHSFGGNVALEYALRYPRSLSHLILMDTGGDQWWVNHCPAMRRRLMKVNRGRPAINRPGYQAAPRKRGWIRRRHAS